MKTRIAAAAGLLLWSIAAPAAAQSPNTAAILVSVVDQTGGLVPGASVSVVNAQTGARREATTNTTGSATFSALPLTGEYRVNVSRPGFADEELPPITLRAGETATLKIKLVATGGTSAVTVYGTTEGVRSDPQIGRRVDDQTIDEIPILGRKVTSLPLLNAAFRQAKGTGDLFVNATYFVTGAGGRRETTVALDGASDDEGWGRQTALITRADRRRPGNVCPVERVLRRVPAGRRARRSTSSPSQARTRFMARVCS